MIWERYYYRNSVSIVTRKKKHKSIEPIPKNVISCLQVQEIVKATSLSTPLKTNTICTPCGLFQNEHGINPRLRDFNDNSPHSGIGRRYSCETPWFSNVLPMDSPSTSIVCYSSSPTPTKDPPILSDQHLSSSPQRDNRPKRSKANYSSGRWSSNGLSTEYEDENNKYNNRNDRKEVVSKAKKPPENHALKIIEIEKEMGRLVAEANEALVQQNLDLQAELTSTIQFQSEIMLSNKRKSQEISSLKKAVSTQTETLHQAERSHESASKKLKNKNKDLLERLHDTRETVLEKQRDILSLQKEKETIVREVDKAYQRGVSEGRRQETNNKITLPPKIDETSLAEFVKEAFTKVHKNKKPHQCAAIAAKAVWNLYDGVGSTGSSTRPPTASPV